jgi:hypothetical protein
VSKTGILTVAATVAAFASTAFAADLGDRGYKEGFGKDATGGAGYPTYVVTSSAASGPGTFAAAFTGRGESISNLTIVFAVDTFTTMTSLHIGSNVTIDGMANGKNGVVFDHGGVDDRPGVPSQRPAG